MSDSVRLTQYVCSAGLAILLETLLRWFREAATSGTAGLAGVTDAPHTISDSLKRFKPLPQGFYFYHCSYVALVLCPLWHEAMEHSSAETPISRTDVQVCDTSVSGKSNLDTSCFLKSRYVLHSKWVRYECTGSYNWVPLPPAHLPASLAHPSPGELVCCKRKVSVNVSGSVQQSFSCFAQWVSLPRSLDKPCLKLPQINVLVPKRLWCKKSILDAWPRSSLTLTGKKGDGTQEA